MSDYQNFFSIFSVTTTIALVALLAWGFLSGLAMDAGMEVPVYLHSRGVIGSSLVVLLGPIIHQSQDFVVGNLLFLLAVGPLLETRVGHWQYLLFGLFAGYGLMVLAYAVGLPTVGLSGATHAFTGREFTGQFQDLVGGDDTVNSVHFAVVAIILTFQISRLFSKGSLVAHGGGLIFGLVVGLAVATDQLRPDWLVQRLSSRQLL